MWKLQIRYYSLKVNQNKDVEDFHDDVPILEFNTKVLSIFTFWANFSAIFGAFNQFDGQLPSISLRGPQGIKEAI